MEGVMHGGFGTNPAQLGDASVILFSFPSGVVRVIIWSR
jgi:hypothetical protein